MPQSLPVVDPVFAEIAKAIYGDIDPRELSKFSPGSSDLHIDGSMTAKQRAKRDKKVALTGMGATTVATAGGLHALSASRHEHLQRMANAGSEPHKAKLAAQHAKSEANRAVRLKRVEGMKGPVGHVARAIVRNPRRAAIAAGTGWAALHGVELGADALSFRAQAKELKRANKTLAKGFQLKPLERQAVPGSEGPPRRKSTAAPRQRPAAIKGSEKGSGPYKRSGGDARIHAPSAGDKKSKPVSKAFRLKPLNALNIRVPNLRAKRPKLTPMPANPATKAGLYQPVRKAVEPHAEPYAGTRHGDLAADVTWTGLIAKVDTDQRQVFGWASVSAVNGQPVVDLQGDIVPIEEMEKSAYRYVIESRKGGDMHKRVAKADEPLHTADMIESFVVTPEKLEKMGLPADALPHGWWVGYHVNDDAQWALVKSGGRKGFSIHGSGKRTAVAKADEKKKATLLDRVDQALSPPKVRLAHVTSSAIQSMGYQPQTRRLAVAMHSRPDEPYQYRMKRAAAEAALDAKSKGRHYAKEIRGKVKRAKGYTLGDRVRLFVNPDVSKAADEDRPTPVKLRALGSAYDKQARSRGKKAAVAGAVGAAGFGTAAYSHRKLAANAHWHAPLLVPKEKADLVRLRRLSHAGRIGGVATAVGAATVAAGHAKLGRRNAARGRQLRRMATAMEDNPNLVKAAPSHGGPPQTTLPNDNRNAQRARARRTAGLGTAGIGYLMATRGQEIAPQAAGLVTRSANKIGQKEHTRRIKLKSKHISRVSGRAGAALTAGGLLLAGEGAISDLRNRGTVGRISRETAAGIRQKMKD